MARQDSEEQKRAARQASQVIEIAKHALPASAPKATDTSFTAVPAKLKSN